MDSINSIVADNLKRLREQKKLSLDAVSRLSGVSKSMLGQIERGDVNPTISTVWKIANGLKVSFTTLLQRPESACEVIDLTAVAPLLEDGGHYRNYTVFPFDAGRHFEMLYIELDPGSHLDAEPHPEGTEEFLTVFSGKLSVEVDDAVFIAADHCGIRFRADRAHRYRNCGDEICRVSMVIFYPA